jgi:hypothetical protein
MEGMGVMENMGGSSRIVGPIQRECELSRSRGLVLDPPLYAARDACTRQPNHLSRYVRLTIALVETPLSRELVPELHCIQPIENVASIMERGILSHDRAAHVPHRSVAMEDIQDRRAKVTVRGTNRKLHSYANVYINGRNKMMIKLVKYTEDVDASELCLLRISDEVLDLPDVVIADRNASADIVRFDPSPAGLANITKELVYATWWYHEGDPIRTYDHGQIVCAEVLVPDVLPPEYITGAYVSCDESASALLDAVDSEGFTVTVRRKMFFA